ncbi:hypothetical protein PV11_04489 [Exophiala sideris]|uniref:Uncharacterized protein n=1 Tax=Exophiala sideris TaxID=1016849 RepID=A0A0D1X415_9EURO|nr:hypothetical protein PV11_04489 [Exophiala sideris]
MPTEYWLRTRSFTTSYEYHPDLVISALIDFPLSPSFGLHFYAGEDLRTDDSRTWPGPCSNWSRSRPSSRCRSLSPSTRWSSAESRHHSDSYLLQRFNTDTMDDSDDALRHTARTLYPDLRSAYAQIQGRRVASSHRTRSSGLETRFPLSASSSSSEDDDDDLNPLTLGNDAIPLQDLPCRRVPSALGILHEAGDHQESSAIFDDTLDAAQVDRSGRQSLTLDEIVAQYADITPADSPLAHSHHNQSYVSTPQQQFLYRSQEEDGTCREDASVGRLPNSTECLLPQNHASSPCHGRGNASIVAQFDESVDTGDDDEEWETPPDTSRRGFLNPSRSRFRLTSRDTGDSSQLNTGEGNSPATPWDPLSNITNQRPGLQRRGRLQHDHQDQYMSPTHRPSKTNHGLILRAQKQRITEIRETQLQVNGAVSKLNSASAPGLMPQTSQLPARASTLSDSTPITLKDNSALPSSTLLPGGSGTAVMDDSDISRFLRDTRITHSSLPLFGGSSRVDTSASLLSTQREAGRLLLVVSVATYFVGGFVLAHDMGKGGALSSVAMAELTGGVVSCVHPVDTQWAQAIEKGGLVVVVCVLAGCVGVLAWSAIM